VTYNVFDGTLILNQSFTAGCRHTFITRAMCIAFRDRVQTPFISASLPPGHYRLPHMPRSGIHLKWKGVWADISLLVGVWGEVTAANDSAGYIKQICMP